MTKFFKHFFTPAFKTGKPMSPGRRGLTVALLLAVMAGTVSLAAVPQSASLTADQRTSDVSTDPLDFHPRLSHQTMQLQVPNCTVSYDMELSDIPFETEWVADDTLEEGTEVVTQAGRNGTYYMYYQLITTPDGRVYRTLIQEGVQHSPVTGIVTYGTYVASEPEEEDTGVGQASQARSTSAGTAGKEESSPASAASAPVEAPSDQVITTSSGETLSYSKVLTCTATAYTAGTGALTATGTTPRVGAIAVDPNVIPYGTRMYIVTSDGSIVYGYATAEDCGGAIKGNKVDLYYDSYDQCIQFGRREVKVYILD